MFYYCLVELSEECIYFSVMARIFIFFLINLRFFMSKNVSDVSVAWSFMMFKVCMPSEHEIRARQYATLSKLLMTTHRAEITVSGAAKEGLNDEFHQANWWELNHFVQFQWFSNSNHVLKTKFDKKLLVQRRRQWRFPENFYLFIYLCYGVSSSLVSPDAVFYIIF